MKITTLQMLLSKWFTGFGVMYFAEEGGSTLAADPAPADPAPADPAPADPAPADPAPADPAPADPAPEDFDYSGIELGDGVTIDETALNLFSPTLKELGLTKDKAEPLFKKFTELRKADEARAVQAYDDYVKTQRAEIQKLPEAEVAIARQAFQKLTEGDEELKAVLSSHEGERTWVVKLMAKVGRLMQDDSWIGGGQSGASDKPTADVLYPTMNKQQ